MVPFATPLAVNAIVKDATKPRDNASVIVKLGITGGNVTSSVAATVSPRRARNRQDTAPRVETGTLDRIVPQPAAHFVLAPNAIRQTVIVRMIVQWDTGVTFAMSDAMLRAQITPVIDSLVRVSEAVSQVNMVNSVTYPVISTAPMVRV